MPDQKQHYLYDVNISGNTTQCNVKGGMSADELTGLTSDFYYYQNFSKNFNLR